MNRLSKIFLALVVLAIVANGQSSETVSGYVTDTLCGKKGANARHVDCAKRSVAAGTAQYAIYDEGTRRLYVLEPQATAAQYAGQRVKVTGAVGYSPLTRAGQVYDSKDRKVHAPTPGVANPRVLDSSTLIEGTLTISSISAADPAPGPAPTRRTATKAPKSDGGQ